MESGDVIRSLLSLRNASRYVHLEFDFVSPLHAKVHDDLMFPSSYQYAMAHKHTLNFSAVEHGVVLVEGFRLDC